MEDHAMTYCVMTDLTEIAHSRATRVTECDPVTNAVLDLSLIETWLSEVEEQFALDEDDQALVRRGHRGLIRLAARLMPLSNVPEQWPDLARVLGAFDTICEACDEDSGV